MSQLEDLAGEQFCYLTTTGRKSGAPHEIEIWFGINGGTLYMLSGGRQRSDWVRNIMRAPDVAVRIRDKKFPGRGRIVKDAKEDAAARKLLLEKYEPLYTGDLTDWGRTALPIAIDLTSA